MPLMDRPGLHGVSRHGVLLIDLAAGLELWILAPERVLFWRTGGYYLEWRQLIRTDLGVAG